MHSTLVPMSLYMDNQYPGKSHSYMLSQLFLLKNLVWFVVQDPSVQAIDSMTVNGFLFFVVIGLAEQDSS